MAKLSLVNENAAAVRLTATSLRALTSLADDDAEDDDGGDWRPSSPTHCSTRTLSTSFGVVMVSRTTALLLELILEQPRAAQASFVDYVAAVFRPRHGVAFHDAVTLARDAGAVTVSDLAAAGTLAHVAELVCSIFAEAEHPEREAA